MLNNQAIWGVYTLNMNKGKKILPRILQIYFSLRKQELEKENYIHNPIQQENETTHLLLDLQYGFWYSNILSTPLWVFFSSTWAPEHTLPIQTFWSLSTAEIKACGLAK